jgi:hypothetical protein
MRKPKPLSLDMGNIARAAGNVLIRGELFEISSEGRIVRCRVRVPTRTAPAAGADAAKQMGEWMIDNVLRPQSSWLGLILDTRDGPLAVGPITLSIIQRVFETAEHSRRPMTVLVEPSSQALFNQFAELASRVAPTYGCVTADPVEAIASLGRPR